MKIVIKIDKKIFEELTKYDEPIHSGNRLYDSVLSSIYDAIPLPEHHGRLIDENELIDEIVCEEIEGRYYDVIYAHSVYDANTIMFSNRFSFGIFFHY